MIVSDPAFFSPPPPYQIAPFEQLDALADEARLAAARGEGAPAAVAAE